VGRVGYHMSRLRLNVSLEGGRLLATADTGVHGQLLHPSYALALGHQYSDSASTHGDIEFASCPSSCIIHSHGRIMVHLVLHCTMSIHCAVSGAGATSGHTLMRSMQPATHVVVPPKLTAPSAHLVDPTAHLHEAHLQEACPQTCTVFSFDLLQVVADFCFSENLEHPVRPDDAHFNVAA
jgi:hypothetical protein